MSVEIFGGGMDYNIEPGLNRALDPRSRKCVIANRNKFVLAHDFPDRLEIDQLQQRIAWSFDPNHARVWFDRALEVFRVGKIDVSIIKIRLTAVHSLEQSDCAALDFVTR